RFAFSQRPALLDVAFEAARGAIQRDAGALDRGIDGIPPRALADDQLLALAPAWPSERPRHARALRARDLLASPTPAAHGVRDRTGTADAFPVTNRHLRAALSARVGASDLKYRKALASYLAVRGFWDQALQEWSAVVARDGRDAEARIGLATTFDAMGRPDG